MIMLCCAGLFAGVMAGAYLGMPWAPFVAIPLGAAGGLLADIKLFRAAEKRNRSMEQQSVGDQPCCAILSLKKRRGQKVAENYVQA
jgi:hypothetical protein